MYATGEKVLARKKGDRYWYPATIAEIGEGRHRVAFEQGGDEWVSEKNINQRSLQAGDRVMCRWKGGANFYTGTVVKFDEARSFIKYDDGDEEWSTALYVKVYPFSVISGASSWWKRLLSPEFVMSQLELVSYLGLFLLILFGLHSVAQDAPTRLPRELFSAGRLAGLTGHYAAGLIPVAVIFAGSIALTFRASMTQHRFFICKAFIINLALSFITVNYIVLIGLLETERLNGLMFFSLFVSLLPPIGIAVYYDARRGRGFLREFLVFAGLLLAATLPQLLRMQFSPDSAVYYFMQLAVVYFAAFFVFIPFEWGKGSQSMWDRLIKITLLNSGIVLVPITYIMVYAVTGMAGEKIFGRGSVPNVLLIGSGGGIFGPVELAPISAVYLFIMEYLRAMTVPDLVEGILLFWSVSAMTMNLSDRANLFHDQGIDFRTKKLEVAAGAILLAVFLSQPFWR